VCPFAIDIDAFARDDARGTNSSGTQYEDGGSRHAAVFARSYFITVLVRTHACRGNALRWAAV